MQLLNPPKKIKIIKSSNPLFWYSKHLGEIFMVIKESPDVYWTREKDSWFCLNFVLKEDTEII